MSCVSPADSLPCRAYMRNGQLKRSRRLNGNAKLVPTAIPAMPPGTSVTTLENGLVIITREDHSAPVVSAQAWCRAGSVTEGSWLGAGLSHVLEHMLFKG